MIHIQVNQHLLIPFGRPKWDISKIRIAGVSTTATHFVSDTPCLYIDKTSEVPARIQLFPKVVPGKFPNGLEPDAALDFIREYLKHRCDLQTDSERLFLDLYFEFIRKQVARSDAQVRQRMKIMEAFDIASLPIPYTSPSWVFEALMPLPQAHLYLDDPLRAQHNDISPSSVPGDMFKVDFAFWTGKRFIAVEIDGSSHIGNESHIRKDRMLQRSGVHVVHILNKELVEYGIEVIGQLLPQEITYFWGPTKGRFLMNPLGPEYPLGSVWDENDGLPF